jgi:hypothetical protein
MSGLGARVGLSGKLSGKLGRDALLHGDTGWLWRRRRSASFRLRSPAVLLPMICLGVSKWSALTAFAYDRGMVEFLGVVGGEGDFSGGFTCLGGLAGITMTFLVLLYGNRSRTARFSRPDL